MSKAEKKRRVSAMLSKWSVDETITGDDDTYLRELIRSHPDYPQKFHDGVARFFVGIAYPYKGRCFRFEAHNGVVDNFGTTWCINGEPPLRGRLLMACRDAIRGDMHAHKREYFGMRLTAPCEASGQALAWEDAHVDHIAPFVVVASDWLAGQSLTLSDLAPDTPGSVGDRFADRGVAEMFRRHHLGVASLRVVSGPINMAKGAR